MGSSCKTLSLQNHSSLVSLLFLIFSFHSQLTSSAPSHPHQCHALLQFKSNFVINASASNSCYESSYPKTESWKESTDCCSEWDGVTCDGESGHVVGLDLSCSHLRGTIHSDSSLFSSHLAPYLRNLNLACNDFQGSKISFEFGVKFGSSLTHFNLSDSCFSGNIPPETSHLSNLVSLDLSFNHGLGFESDRVVEMIAQNLTQLRVVNLDGLNMSSVHASSLMNLSSSLTFLSLVECQLQGQFPTSFLLRPNLQKLDLTGNNFRFITSPPNFNSTNNLKFLSLRQTDLSTSIGFLDFVGNHLKSLRLLYLSGCNISGRIPLSLGNLIELRELYLRDNHLSGPIPPSLGNLTNLVALYLGDNNLTGSIPTSFSNLTRLADLDMSYNELDGPLPSYLFALPSLEYIDLSHNMLHGQIPTSPIKSIHLIRLDLSHNNLSSSQDFDVFLTLRELVELDLSNNNISSSISIYTNLTYSLPSLQVLVLSGCNFNQFPTFIKALTNLTYLDVSNNQIQGPIPEWISDVGKDTLSYIDLSGNLLTSVGHEFHWRTIEFVDFHSNLLQGPLPIPPKSTTFFSVSNNTLSGEISSLICNLSQLAFLDLSHNQFVGSIPQCLVSLSSLWMLNLRVNKLHGVIPNTFAKNNSLTSLVLNGNQLTGGIPRTLSYCHNLQVFNLGNNMIEDTVPHWLKTLPSLEVLVLQSNKFYGSLNSFKDKLCFPALKILDLSNNNFDGRFPIQLIKNLNAMTRVDGELEGGSEYMKNSLYGGLYYSVMITVKGSEMEFIKILTTLATIDLSRNKFEGHIPEVIGELILLKGLNLSHNLLTGHIPSSMGDLDNLEWLDLSHNELTGQIPRELTDLNFLQVLDLSSNKLDGMVPQGKQFNTFGNDSYKDNLALCGFPLSKACGEIRETSLVASGNEDYSHFESGSSWECVFVGYGCGIVFGLSVGYLVFKSQSPKWIVRMAERKEQHGRVGRGSKRQSRARN